VAGCWEWHSAASQIGFRYTKPDEADDFWEVWVYPAVQEIVGGKEDGETVWSGFNFDVLEFLKDFEPEALDISTRQPSRPSEHRNLAEIQAVAVACCQSAKSEPPGDGEEPFVHRSLSGEAVVGRQRTSRAGFRGVS
jgi:hypothetical protein